MRNRLKISLLGQIDIRRNDAPVDKLTGKTLALLSYLAVSTGPHPRPALAGLLWGGMPESKARGNLSKALSTLRREFEPHLIIKRQTVAFNRESDYWLDVETFESRAQNLRPEDDEDDIEGLREAVQLYRGDFLEGLYIRDALEFEQWVLTERVRLRDLALGALYALAGHFAGQGAIGREKAIGYTAELLRLEPWREDAHREMMQLLAQNGQRGAALAQYEACRRMLAEELGVEPGVETVELYERIRDGDLAEGSSHSLPTSKTSTQRHNLPAQTTPFVGRERQLAQLRELLARPEVRLLTLTGPGGAGKTRLALQVAAEILEDAQAPFPEGVFFVPLAPLRDPDLVVGAIAAALGISESRDTPLLESLRYALRDRELLLVLDNFEHVTEVAPAVGELLAAASSLKVLVTSRAPLNVYAENEYAVPPMVTPEADDLVPRPQGVAKSHLHGPAGTVRRTSDRVGESEGPLERLGRVEAVHLFVTRAARVRADFALTAENAQAVGEICRRLHGLPLAIELAAAWVRLLSPAEIVAEISQDLDFLETTQRDVPARQRSMRAVFDHSWRLLTPREQEMYQALSVFRGGFTREAADEIAGASTRKLMALVERSVLRRTEDGRYELHELLRQYAEERLEKSGDDGDVRDRHAAYFATTLDGAATDLKGVRQLEALAEVEADLDNARVAWAWAIERREVAWLDLGLEGLCLYLEWRSHYEEGEAACRKAAERLETRPEGRSPEVEERGPASRRLRVLAHTLAWQGRFSFMLGRNEVADRCFERSLALLEGPELRDEDTRGKRAFVLWCKAERTFSDDHERANNLAERSLALYRALGDRCGAANALRSQGQASAYQAAYDQALPRLEESLALARELDDLRGIAHSLGLLGHCAANLGQFERAERVLADALATTRQLGDRRLSNDINGVLSLALHNSGRFLEAEKLREKWLAFCRDQGDRPGELVAMQSLIHSRRHLGAYRETGALARRALDLSRESRPQLTTACGWLALGRVALAEGAYDAAGGWLGQCLAALQKLGASFLVGETHAALAYTSRALGRPERARRHLREALHLAAETRFRNSALQVLPAMALLLVDAEQVERAVEFYALACRYPYVANSVWFKDVAGIDITAAADALPPDIVAAAQERGREKDLWAAVEELLQELQ